MLWYGPRKNQSITMSWTIGSHDVKNPHGFFEETFRVECHCELRHAYCHMVHSLQHSDENTRNHKTLAEEDALGKLTRLASACHGATVVQRFFQRFGLFLSMHWDNIIRNGGQAPDPVM